MVTIEISEALDFCAHLFIERRERARARRSKDWAQLDSIHVPAEQWGKFPVAAEI